MRKYRLNEALDIPKIKNFKLINHQRVDCVPLFPGLIEKNITTSNFRSSLYVNLSRSFKLVHKFNKRML